MLKYIIKRILYIILIFFILSFILYSVYQLIPDDIGYQTAIEEIRANKDWATDEEMKQERIAYWRSYYGTDGNLLQRYGRWIGIYPYQRKDANGQTYYDFDGLLEGQLGKSTTYNVPVMELVKPAMRNTILINVVVVILCLAITIPLGIFCAVKKGSKRDTAIQVGTIVSYGVPTFIIAILFIWLFSIVLKFFPVSGQTTAGKYTQGTWGYFWDEMYHLALPIIIMVFNSLGGMTRYVRAAMVDALSMDCIRTARAKGVKEKVVIYSHAFRNALIPLVILIIGWFVSIFSGSIMVENIFGLNGIGRVLYQGLTNRDYPVILSLQMFYVLLGLVSNLICDISYGFIDPRIRVNK